MAAFRDDPAEWQRLDWQLLQNSPVALYYRPAIIAEDIAWLCEHGYRIDEFQCPTWASVKDFLADAKRVFAFPDFFGHNLNAFDDCLSELEIPDEGGRCIVLHHFDAFARQDAQAAEAILDIVAVNSRFFLLQGRRLLALVQSADPKIEFQPVGACPVMWNPREWLNANRGL